MESVSKIRPLDLKTLSLDDINRYLRKAAERFSPGTMQLQVTSLRSFVRYLHHSGDIPADIAGGIVSVRRCRLSGLPATLKSAEVEALLASCYCSTVSGLRSYAILLLMARLGLRACEVVWLTLDDIDWHTAVVTVRGKGSRRDLLPLPQDVGEAIAAYLLDGRPTCTTRRIFVTIYAPYRGLSSPSAIFGIFHAAVIRSGIELPASGAAHLLRHALASRMLGNGASLEEIGQKSQKWRI